MTNDKLTHGELGAIEEIAQSLDDYDNNKLMDDVKIAGVEIKNKDRSIIAFLLPGYSRPDSVNGQESYPFEGQVDDKDGEKLSVILYKDINGRLVELELIRYASGDVVGPNWDTFRVVPRSPSELTS